MNIEENLLGQASGVAYASSQFKLNFGLMGNIDCMIGLSGKERLEVRVGVCVGCILNSFSVFFLNSDVLFYHRVGGVGVVV